MVSHIASVNNSVEWTFLTKPWRWEALRMFIEAEFAIEGKTEAEIAWMLTLESA